MKQPKILFLTDDPPGHQALVDKLRQKQIKAAIAQTIPAAIDRHREESFHLVVINVCRSQLDGIEACRQLSPHATNPILLFDHRHDEPYILEAYRAGVDEYEGKPITTGVLLAKVNAWLRHSWLMPTDLLSPVDAGLLRLDPAWRSLITPNGAAIRLTNQEFRLLHLLMSRPGEILPTETILDRVWGPWSAVSSDVLKHAIHHLRDRLGPEWRGYLRNERGVGYSFDL